MKFMCYAAPVKVDLIDAFREDVVMDTSNDGAEYPGARSKYSSITVRDTNNKSRLYDVNYNV